MEKRLDSIHHGIPDALRSTIFDMLQPRPSTAVWTEEVTDALQNVMLQHSDICIFVQHYEVDVDVDAQSIICKTDFQTSLTLHRRILIPQYPLSGSCTAGYSQQVQAGMGRLQSQVRTTISPAGRPIYKYESPMELLMVLHNAIKTHGSLYLDGNILHWDISKNNIIITSSKKADGHMGMLIDLNLAKEVGSECSSAQHQTSTTEYMAIKVLLNVNQTYCHNPESFFYVLIWQCGHRSWEKLDELQRQGQD
ncbi:hypothetical protein PABG_02952 [Paracoccidioides brasiliensis Pb03]|nr:hypothetical protein PABG_02952 [Paracoccidioides brasiliensis Pb03]